MIEEGISDQIDWAGSALYFDARLGGGYIRCRVPRHTIPAIRLYSDATERGIASIASALCRMLRRFIARAGAMLELLPDEVRA